MEKGTGIIYTNQEYDKEKLKSVLYNHVDVKPNQKVVIKPNWVSENHLKHTEQWEQIITHPTLVEAVTEIALEKLGGTGKLTVADSSMAGADFDKIVSHGNLRERLLALPTNGTEFSVLDLRPHRDITKGDILVKNIKLPGDPLGAQIINLKKDSMFHSKENQEYFGADYDVDQCRKFHNSEDNIYHLSKTILESDVLIHLPKLKTHRLAGLTCGMKSVVGITVFKNSLPHYTVGTPENNGDDYDKAGTKSALEIRILGFMRKIWKHKNVIINTASIPFRKLYTLFADSKGAKTIRGGIWHGNDTIWRMVLDLDRIVMYADAEGTMKDTPQRKQLFITDAILCGENFGPLQPDKKECGLVLVADNPVTMDMISCAIMGFDYEKVPVLKHSFELEKYRLSDVSPSEIKISSIDKRYDTKTIADFCWDESLQFIPPFGWLGNIEKQCK